MQIVAGIHLSAHCHATEDCERVERALMNVLPKELQNKVRITRRTVEGFHGNPITILEVAISSEDGALFFENLLNKLNEQDLKYISETLDMRLDSKSSAFYIRLDKQQAYMGRVVVAEGDDVIRVRISLKSREGVETIRGLVLQRIKQS